MTREEAVEIVAKKLAQNGWSSIYSFVERHLEDYEWPEEEED